MQFWILHHSHSTDILTSLREEEITFHVFYFFSLFILMYICLRYTLKNFCIYHRYINILNINLIILSGQQLFIPYSQFYHKYQKSQVCQNFRKKSLFLGMILYTCIHLIQSLIKSYIYIYYLLKKKDIFLS